MKCQFRNCSFSIKANFISTWLERRLSVAGIPYTVLHELVRDTTRKSEKHTVPKAFCDLAFFLEI